MAADAPRRCTSCTPVAVVLLLCSLIPSFSCFPQKALGKNQPWKLASLEFAMRPGKILFNGKVLDPSQGLSLPESDVSGVSEQESQSDLLEAEAAWQRTDPSLQCGPQKMILRVTGLGAANLELNLGTGHTVALTELSDSCGYIIYQNALGLVLVVPYDGCNVLKENGDYVLPMSFLENSVTLSCPVPPALTSQHPFLQIPLNVDRSKRGATQGSSKNDPYSQYQDYQNYLNYLYYLHIINNPHMYPFVHRTYNPLHQRSEPLSHGYAYLPMHYPLYAQYPQNPAAPYCHPPGALCPLPHFLSYPHHQPPPKQDRRVEASPEPTEFTTRPTPLAATPIPTRKPCRRTTTPPPPPPPAAAAAARATPAPATTSKRRCRPRIPPEDNMKPHSSNPFAEEILYGEDRQLPADPYGAGYNSGPLMKYQYWQHQPWFADEDDEGIPFDWDELDS
ncbi:uncharacterized protein LOC133511277 [Syngnathoides biaculeatus]|uniref:uncharacterized protein LOC133511277 n=1 Tax=Syngnathoides biaculeatus TaxID=300417 RepID=UPI002ADE02D7|nr:uncharacterized protein LOC133511277 [Syngnathoides biaculeatus]